MVLSQGVLASALAASIEACDALRVLLAPPVDLEFDPASPAGILPPPAPLRRCIGGPILAQLDTTVGTHGIILVFNEDHLLRAVVLQEIEEMRTMEEAQIDADLAVFSAFLRETQFGTFERIGAEAAPIAVRHIFWTLLKAIPGDNSKLKLALRRFSPKQFGYELGPWEHNPDAIEDFGEFLANIPTSLPNFAVGGGGGGSDEPLPENLFGLK